MPEVAVKLTGDNSEFRSTLSESVQEADKFGGQLAGKLGDKLYGLRDVSHTIATALGLNLENIAEKLAMALVHTSEAEQEAYKKATELGDQATDAAIKNMRARASEETRYQLALKDREKLVKEIDESVAIRGVSLLKVAQQKIELEKTNADILEIENKRAEEQKKIQDELVKKGQERAISEQKLANDRESAELKLLSLADRKRIITDEEKSLKAFIALGTISEAAAQEKTNFLAKEKNALLAEEVAHKKALALSLQDELTIFELQRKIATGLTSDEKARLDVLMLQKKEKQAIIEIETLGDKLIQGTITPAEKARLDQLIRQDEKLKTQIEKKQKLIDLANNQAKAEQRVLTEFEQQLEVIQKMTGGNASAAASRYGFTLGGSSDPKLDAARQALQNAINSPQDFTNPSYTRNVFEAQTLVNSLERGEGGNFDIKGMADAALGKQSNSTTSTLSKIVKATTATAAAVKSVGDGLAGTGLIIKSVTTTGPGGAPDSDLPDFSEGQIFF